MTSLLGCRILVVEDEPLVAELTADVLIDAGASIVGPAVSVAAALTILAHNTQLDAAVLDFVLGRETAKPIAATLAARDVPYVYSTAYGGDPRLAGAAPVLIKPYPPDALVMALLAVCGPHIQDS